MRQNKHGALSDDNEGSRPVAFSRSRDHTARSDSTQLNWSLKIPKFSELADWLQLDDFLSISVELSRKPVVSWSHRPTRCDHAYDPIQLNSTENRVAVELSWVGSGNVIEP